jgi:hypothetical protein
MFTIKHKVHKSVTEQVESKDIIHVKAQTIMLLNLPLLSSRWLSGSHIFVQGFQNEVLSSCNPHLVSLQQQDDWKIRGDNLEQSFILHGRTYIWCLVEYWVLKFPETRRVESILCVAQLKLSDLVLHQMCLQKQSVRSQHHWQPYPFH